MKAISIGHHSGYGHTTAQAKGIDSVNGVSADLIASDQDGEICESEWQKLDASDVIVFGSPTYMGMASW